MGLALSEGKTRLQKKKALRVTVTFPIECLTVALIRRSFSVLCPHHKKAGIRITSLE